jgi:energy-coupling factor transport system permease protein
MRSALAYAPRPGPLGSASAAAAIVFLASFVVAAFLFESPVVVAGAGIGVAIAGLLTGARRAVWASFCFGLSLAVLITLVNGLVTDRGDTVLARLGDWPLFGEVNVTAEALAAGAVIGLRAMAAMIAGAVYSSCVNPDNVLRLLRPIAGRSALTATLITRMVPLAAADAGRLREASMLRGPAAAPVGRGAMARRLLAGSLDRSVDVAATLELRGYGSAAPPPSSGPAASRHDRRFWLTGAALVLIAVTAKIAGADQFESYPTVEVGLDPGVIVLAAGLVAAGLAAAPSIRARGRGGTHG